MPETQEVTIPRSPEDLTQLFGLLEEALIDNGGEATAEIDNLLASIELGNRDLVDRYGHFVRHLEARAAAMRAHVKDYAEPLERKAQSSLNLAKRLKDRLHAYMVATDQKELKGDFRSVKLQLSPEALEVTEAGKQPGAFPAEFYHQPALDSMKVKQATKQLGGEFTTPAEWDTSDPLQAIAAAEGAPCPAVVLARLTRGSHARIY